MGQGRHADRLLLAKRVFRRSKRSGCIIRYIAEDDAGVRSGERIDCDKTRVEGLRSLRRFRADRIV
jgi:hypothetical protein